MFIAGALARILFVTNQIYSYSLLFLKYHISSSYICVKRVGNTQLDVTIDNRFVVVSKYCVAFSEIAPSYIITPTTHFVILTKRFVDTINQLLIQIDFVDTYC